MGGGASSSNSPERVKGIEPSSQAWKAYALPLSYTRGQSRLISRPPRPPFFASFFSLCFAALLVLSFVGKAASSAPQPSLFRWRGQDSNLRRLSRQIYSLIPLTAREPLPSPSLSLNPPPHVKRIFID